MTMFLGQEISKYGLKCGYVDYACLARTFNHVGFKEFQKLLRSYDWEVVNGSDAEGFEDGEIQKEFARYFIITKQGYDILSRYTEECVLYNDELDLYVWAVEFYGVLWECALTDIKIEDLEGE